MSETSMHCWPKSARRRVLTMGTPLLSALMGLSALAIAAPPSPDSDHSVVPNYSQASRFSAKNLRPFLYDTSVNSALDRQDR